MGSVQANEEDDLGEKVNTAKFAEMGIRFVADVPNLILYGQVCQVKPYRVRNGNLSINEIRYDPGLDKLINKKEVVKGFLDEFYVPPASLPDEDYIENLPTKTDITNQIEKTLQIIEIKPPEIETRFIEDRLEGTISFVEDTIRYDIEPGDELEFILENIEVSVKTLKGIVEVEFTPILEIINYGEIDIYDPRPVEPELEIDGEIKKVD